MVPPSLAIRAMLNLFCSCSHVLETEGKPWQRILGTLHSTCAPQMATSKRCRYRAFTAWSWPSLFTSFDLYAAAPAVNSEPEGGGQESVHPAGQHSIASCRAEQSRACLHTARQVMFLLPAHISSISSTFNIIFCCFRVLIRGGDSSVLRGVAVMAWIHLARTSLE